MSEKKSQSKTVSEVSDFLKSERIADMNRRRLALFLRTIRRSRGLSRAELAEKAGYESQAIITAIESSSKNPDDSKVIDLANALDVSIEQLKGYGKIELTDKGWPKLSESEKIALYLVAPILRELNDEETRHLMDTGLLLLKAKGREPAWKKPVFSRDKQK